MLGGGDLPIAVVPTQESLGHITQMPQLVSYQSNGANGRQGSVGGTTASAQRLQEWVGQSRPPMIRAGTGPIAGPTGSLDSIQADIVVEAVGGNVLKSPQVNAAEVRGGMGLLTPRGMNAGILRSSSSPTDGPSRPSLLGGEPLFPSRVVTGANVPEHPDVKSAGGNAYKIPAIKQEGLLGTRTAGQTNGNGEPSLASTSARDGSDNSLLSTVGAAVIPSANQNTTPKNAMAYTITPTGLPVLQHKAPKDGPLDTPRPPNFDAFVEKYDEFDRESLDPKEGGVNPKRNTKKLSIASEAGGVGVVGEALVGVSQAAPSVSSSLAQRGKIPSDISRRTLKSAGRMNSIARMHRLSVWFGDRSKRLRFHARRHLLCCLSPPSHAHVTS